MTRKPVGRLSFENERNDVSHDVIADIDRILSTNHVMEPELNIGLLLWPEFPLLALAGLTDTLRHAADIGDNSKKMRCSWNLMSADPARSVCASSGFRIHADSTHLPPENFDYIAVIGGLLRSLSQGAAADRNYLHLAHQKGVPVIGICTGSFILAEEGLLKGHTAAVHPFHLKDFHARFPAINAVAGKDYIDGG
ncbi:MAG TPA: AraC family transcriptional regulator, partial [Buttiauxella sp.]